MIAIDSCHSRWVFDIERCRFRRAPKAPGMGLVVTEWRPYHELHIDEHSDSFTVVLNEAGTRMPRSWRHTKGVCPNCGSRTAELAAEDFTTISAPWDEDFHVARIAQDRYP